MKTGVFWVIDDELIAIPFDKFKYVEGIAKSGETYNHEKLWELVMPKIAINHTIITQEAEW